MHEKEKQLVDAFVRGSVSRRDLLRGLGALGVTAATASFMVNAAATKALAQNGFDWKKHAGTTIKLLLNKHPYTDAMLANIENFKELSDPRLGDLVARAKGAINEVEHLQIGMVAVDIEGVDMDGRRVDRLAVTPKAVRDGQSGEPPTD